MRHRLRSRTATCAASLVACLLASLALTRVTAPEDQSAPTPNRVIEANRAGLARLTVELRAEGSKEPQTFEFKATDGLAFGGILLPDQRVEYTITAYGPDVRSPIAAAARSRARVRTIFSW